MSDEAVASILRAATKPTEEEIGNLARADLVDYLRTKSEDFRAQGALGSEPTTLHVVLSLHFVEVVARDLAYALEHRPLVPGDDPQTRDTEAAAQHEAHQNTKH